MKKILLKIKLKDIKSKINKNNVRRKVNHWNNINEEKK